MRTLKRERVHLSDYQGFLEALVSISQFIEGVYDQRRMRALHRGAAIPGGIGRRRQFVAGPRNWSTRGEGLKMGSGAPLQENRLSVSLRIQS
jgi:hypothetical protein